MSVPPVGVRFVRLYDRDNGKTVGLKLGEELHVILPESSPNPTTWPPVLYTQVILRFVQMYFTPDPGNSQVGTRTLAFCTLKSGQAKVKLTTTGHTTWECTANVK